MLKSQISVCWPSGKVTGTNQPDPAFISEALKVTLGGLGSASAIFYNSLEPNTYHRIGPAAIPPGRRRRRLRPRWRRRRPGRPSQVVRH